MLVVTKWLSFSSPSWSSRLIGRVDGFTMKSSLVSKRIGYQAPKPDTATNTKSNENIISSFFSTFLSSSTPSSSMVEKVLQNPQFPTEWPYTVQDFQRMDESTDTLFYQSPRLVYHIDDACVNALTKYYATVLKDGDDVLDICSSWVSHYPPNGWKGNKVIGLGMNEYELSQNKQLTDYIVKDLNQDPVLPFDDATFDVVTCVVSVDYLNQPLSIFQEMGRVLRPNGTCIISISNRCFPTKAYQIWLQTSDLEHIFIVGSFFHYTQLFQKPIAIDCSPNPGRTDPLYIIQAQRKE
jgi:SAM-dependent methyltransferase